MASAGPPIPSTPADPDAPPAEGGPLVITIAWDPETDDVRVQADAAATVIVGILSRAHHQTNAVVMAAVAQRNRQREQLRPHIARATS